MSKRFFVEAHEDCGRCKGDGIVQDYRWERYWREHPSGVFDPLDFFQITYGLSRSEIPSEDMECPACNNSGVIITKMPLEEALKQLAVMA